MRSAKIGDVIYCDPPYLPADNLSSFVSYTKGGFNSDCQQKLADLAVEMGAKGIPVIISNHDTERARELYALAKIDQFNVHRYISHDAANRGFAPELLATFAS